MTAWIYRFILKEFKKNVQCSENCWEWHYPGEGGVLTQWVNKSSWLGHTHTHTHNRLTAWLAQELCTICSNEGWENYTKEARDDDMMIWCWVGYEVLVCPERMHKFRTSSSRKLKLTWVHLEIAVCLLIYKVTYKLQDQNSITSHTHTRLTALFPGLPRWAGTRKVKPIWILLK